MSENGIHWEAIKDTTNRAFPFAVLGITYILISFFVIGTTQWEFPYGILYGLGFFAVAIVLAAKKIGFLAGLMGAMVPGFATFVSTGGFEANAGMWVGFIGFAVLLANEYGVIEWQKRTVGAKYLVFAPLIFWLIWAFSYFWIRFTQGWEMPIATILNHGGIALLSLDAILYLSGILKKTQQWLKWIGLGAAVMGAIWLTAILGWGLQLAH